MCLVSPPAQCSSFWWKIKFLQPQPPYSPDLTLCNVWSFQRLRIGHPQKKLHSPRQQVSQPAISKENFRGASSNGRTTEQNTYVQKGRTFKVTMFHSIHTLLITNYNWVPETSRSSHINILLAFSFHGSCWSTDDLPFSFCTMQQMIIPTFLPLPLLWLSTYPPTFPENWHIQFFPNNSASTWTSICHPKYGGSVPPKSCNTHLLHSAETQKRPSTDPRSFLHIVTYLFIPLLMEISEENISLLCHYDWKKRGPCLHTLKVLSNSNHKMLITINKNNYYIENVLTWSSNQLFNAKHYRSFTFLTTDMRHILKCTWNPSLVLYWS